MNVILIYVGLLGVVIAAVDFNQRYETKIHTITQMDDQIKSLEYKIQKNREKIQTIDFLTYKVHSFSKRYPVYSEILDSVYKKSIEYGYDTDLILSIIQVESNFKPTAVSHRGAYGLMQVNLSVWRNELAIDESKIFDVDYNIGLGVEIFDRYYKESRGNLNRALHLYNNGYLYNNRSYVDKVTRLLPSFKLGGVQALQAGKISS
jgi:soluble lytic murein transglycosylase-like protein